MTVEKRTEYGTLAINDEVLGAIVQSTVLEIDGVADVGVFGLGEGLSELIRKDSGIRGIAFQETDGGLVVEIAVMVYYGVRIPELGRIVVQRVSEALAEAVSIRPVKVAVEVQGIQQRDSNRHPQRD
ncbi:MAG TPA: hypothetical protein DD856_09845 [Sulfobacillus sp.]|nr:hypothetical protein [Sulfobacillus sp.]